MADALQKKYPNVPVVDEKYVLERQNLILVDVREEHETKISMIPNAITMKEFEANKANYRHHEVVTYCTIGVRSTQYAKKLSADGFTALNLKGGVLAWAHADMGFVSKNGATKTVHVYSKAWNLLPKNYTGVFEE